MCVCVCARYTPPPLHPAPPPLSEDDITSLFSPQPVEQPAITPPPLPARVAEIVIAPDTYLASSDSVTQRNGIMQPTMIWIPEAVR